MASNTNIDPTGERMSDTGISAMCIFPEITAVTIINEHGSSWDDDFGEVTRHWVTENHELMIRVKLDSPHHRIKAWIKARSYVCPSGEWSRKRQWSGLPTADAR